MDRVNVPAKFEVRIALPVLEIIGVAKNFRGVGGQYSLCRHIALTGTLSMS